MKLKLIYNKILFCLRLPLIWGSWKMYQLARAYIRRKAMRQSLLLNSNNKPCWEYFSRIMDHPYGIPYLMTTGPRWNTHAFIAMAIRLKVKKTIEIEAQVADESTKAWTVVVYDQLSRTIAYRGSSQRGDQAWESICVEPGLYSLGLRYYESTEQALLPRIKVDGVIVVENKDCLEEFDSYQQKLLKVKQRRSLFYTAIHYYVYALLKWPNLSTEQRIRQEYLPVGNPETLFRYGAIDKGERLHVRCSEQLLEKALIYLTILNQSSFPQMWGRVENADYESAVMSMSGTWLIRIVKIKEDDIEEELEQLSICSR